MSRVVIAAGGLALMLGVPCPAEETDSPAVSIRGLWRVDKQAFSAAVMATPTFKALKAEERENAMLGLRVMVDGIPDTPFLEITEKEVHFKSKEQEIVVGYRVKAVEGRLVTLAKTPAKASAGEVVDLQFRVPDHHHLILVGGLDGDDMPLVRVEGASPKK